MFLYSLVAPFSVNAANVEFTLTPQAPPYTRGQEVAFTIGINTQGTTVTTSRIGLQYDTAALQYLGISPGPAMQTVTITDLGGGKLVLTGNNTTGFSGTGNFATVNFKIIAANAGETTLCEFFNPEVVPTARPTVPIPTTMPKTGGSDALNPTIIAGILFVGVSYFFYRKNKV